MHRDRSLSHAFGVFNIYQGVVMKLRLLLLCFALLLPACVSTQPKLFEVPTGREKANVPFWWMPHEAAQATLERINFEIVYIRKI